MFDPEPAYARIRMGQGQAIRRHRVREIRRVEVQADPPRSGPIDPAAEVFGLERVTLDFLATRFRVAGMKVDTMRARHQNERLIQVGAELIGRHGFSRIIAGDGQSGTERLSGVFEPTDVVPLPAVKRDRDGRQPLERALDVDGPFRVLVLRQGESLFDCRTG